MTSSSSKYLNHEAVKGWPECRML